MALIDIGQDAPAFNLKDEQGKPHALKDFAGRILVLYFYSSDGSAVCTTEACAFRDQHQRFADAKAEVMGVSPDDQASHEAFSKKNKLGFRLLSDTERDGQGQPKTAAAYGVWEEKTMYGKKVVGVVRTTYLIDKEGKVAKRWDNVRVRGHAQEVLAAARLLEKGQLKDGEAVEEAGSPDGRKTRLSRGDQKMVPTRAGGPGAGGSLAPPRAGSGRAQKGS